jgi:hypothetical protein
MKINLTYKSIFEINCGMKKIIALSMFLLTLNLSYGQYSLAFCKTIGLEGQPQSINNAFTVGSSGATLKLFVKADEGFDTEQVKFTIYYINALGNEEELQSLTQKTEQGWNYLWKEVVLFDPGTYRVKVYSAKGTYLTSANLNIKAQ